MLREREEVSEGTEESEEREELEELEELEDVFCSPIAAKVFIGAQRVPRRQNTMRSREKEVTGRQCSIYYYAFATFSTWPLRLSTTASSSSLIMR